MTMPSLARLTQKLIHSMVVTRRVIVRKRSGRVDEEREREVNVTTQFTAAKWTLCNLMLMYEI